MKPHDCCLTLSLPFSLEAHVVGHLLDHPEWVDGFSAIEIEGHGQIRKDTPDSELVRGRTRRRYVQIVLAMEDAKALLAHLRTALPSKEIAYWITPVLEFGRLA